MKKEQLKDNSDHTLTVSPIIEWWQEQWAQNANPMVRLQLAWMESLSQTMRFEAEFLATMAQSSLKWANCFQGEDAPSTPAEMHRCYQTLIKHATDAHMERMEKATTLSHDFRKRIWEEIC